MSDAGFDLSTTMIHLGLGARATPMPDLADHASDGCEGRPVCITDQHATWDSWERHPAREEVVVLLSGRVDLVQLIEGAEHVVSLSPGLAAVNPQGVWHRSVVHEPGRALFITPGSGTEHRPT